MTDTDDSSTYHNALVTDEVTLHVTLRPEGCVVVCGTSYGHSVHRGYLINELACRGFDRHMALLGRITKITSKAVWVDGKRLSPAAFASANQNSMDALRDHNAMLRAYRRAEAEGKLD